MLFRLTFLCCFIGLLFSCADGQSKKAINSDSIVPKHLEQLDTLKSEEYAYHEFKPDSIRDLSIPNFDLQSAYTLQGLKVVVGIFTNEQIDFSQAEPLSDYGGKRLLILNAENEVIYRSAGGGDIYLMEPHFYRNKSNGKQLIVLQLAFEYFCGAEVYLMENQRIEAVGNLDIASDEMEESLIDILDIREKNKTLLFSFRKDRLLVHPLGAEEEMRTNNNIHYRYSQGKLSFYP